MASKIFKANNKYPSIPTITADPKSHTAALQAIAEAISIHERRTKDLDNSFVRVKELVDLGLITLVGGDFNVIGVDLSSIADVGDLTGASEGDFLRFRSGEWLNDQLDASDILQGFVTQHQAALSIATTQIPGFDEEAQDAVGTILADSGTIDFIYLDSTPLITAIVIDNSIADAKIRQSAGLSLVGRAANTTGNVADITAASDSQVLRRSGTAIGFGAIDLSAANAITGDLPFTNLTQGSARSVLAVAGASIADFASLAAGSDDTVLGRTSGSLSFGQLTVGMFPANVVTYAKIQQVSATSRVLGRITTGAGDIEELTGANLATIIGTSLGANPSASVGLTAVNGTAGTYMRSDGAPALDQGIAPTWTSSHVYSKVWGASGTETLQLTSNLPAVLWSESDAAANSKKWVQYVNSSLWRLSAFNDAETVETIILTADRSGNIGINTNTPNLTAVGTALTILGTGTARGVLEFGSTSGTVGAFGQFAAYNGATFAAALQFFSDGVNTDAGGMKCFVKASGGTIAEAFRVDSNAQSKFVDGSAAAPCQTYLLDTDTGRYRIGANNIGDAVGGVLLVDYSANRVAYSAPVCLPNSTVAGLVAAGTAGAGALAFVTDATQTAILGLGLAVVGGGTNKVPVYSDGTNWIII